MFEGSTVYTTFTEPLTDAILHRIPAVEKAEIRQMINGPESFTPDARAILGEAPEVSSCSCKSPAMNILIEYLLLFVVLPCEDQELLCGRWHEF